MSKVFRIDRKNWKRAAALVVLSACLLGNAAFAYGGEPSGPAFDTEIAGRSKKAVGPGAAAEKQALETGGGAEGAGSAAESGRLSQESPDPQEKTGPKEIESSQDGLTASETLPAENGQSQEAPEGLVFSGGRYLDPRKPMVALTFDDGPYAPVGNGIMDCLEKYNGRSTFFVVGNRVSSYKTEIKRMYDSGHEVANHTYEHKYLNTLGADQIRSQVEKCSEAIAAVTGQAPALVRLPGGNKNSTVLANVKAPIIMWSVDTRDWKTRDAGKTVEAVLSQVKDGDIILMHELYSQTGEAVAAIVPALAERGFQMVTVSELAGFRGGLESGTVYYSFRP